MILDEDEYGVVVGVVVDENDGLLLENQTLTVKSFEHLKQCIHLKVL